MINIFKNGIDFYIESNIDEEITVSIEKFDIINDTYDTTNVIKLVLAGNSSTVQKFTKDGKYRISYKGNITNISSTTYKYIECYNNFLKEIIKSTETFLCCQSCCDTDLEVVEQSNYTINNLLGYFNLSLNSNLNYSYKNSANIADIFIRNILDSQRLDFLKDFTTAAKKHCISNELLTVPLSKKLCSIYFSAIYFLDFFNQQKVQNYNENIKALNNFYNINTIEKGINKQGITFKEISNIFKDTAIDNNNLIGKNVNYVIEYDIDKEQYLVDIDLVTLFKYKNNNTKVYDINLRILTLPLHGELYYINTDGTENKILDLKTYTFDPSNDIKIRYRYKTTPLNNSDLFLFTISNTDNILFDNINTVAFNLQDYKVEEEQEIPLQTPIYKVLNTDNVIDFSHYHVYKTLLNKLDIYKINYFYFDLPNNYLEKLEEDGKYIKDTNITIDRFKNNLYLKKGTNADISKEYPADVIINYLSKDGSNKSVKVRAIIKFVKESELESSKVLLSINGETDNEISINYPFYQTTVELLPEVINNQKDDSFIYFSTKDSKTDEFLEFSTLDNTRAVLENSYPSIKNITITASNNRYRNNYNLILNNTFADIKLYWKDNNGSKELDFTNSLGNGKIKHSAWEIGSIGTESSHIYKDIDNQITYLEVYPQDKFSINNPNLKNIEILSTFKKLEIYNTNIGNSVFTLINNLINTTSNENINNIFSSLIEPMIYLYANNTKNINYDIVNNLYSLYKKSFDKGIIINLGKKETIGNETVYYNPRPVSNDSSNKLFPEFNLSLSGVYKTDVYYPKLKISNNLKDLKDIADCNIYVILEGLNVNEDYISFGSKYFYNKVTLLNNIEESITEEDFKSLKVTDDTYTFRLVYFDGKGKKVSEPFKIKANIEDVSDVYLKSFYKEPTSDIIYNIELGGKLIAGQDYKLIISADKESEYILKSYTFTKQKDQNVMQKILFDTFAKYVPNSATLYAILEKEGKVLDIIPINDISHKISYIPRISDNNTISGEYEIFESDKKNIDTLIYFDSEFIPKSVKDLTVYTDIYVAVDYNDGKGFHSIAKKEFIKIDDKSKDFYTTINFGVETSCKVKLIVSLTYFKNGSDTETLIKQMDSYTTYINII